MAKSSSNIDDMSAEEFRQYQVQQRIDQESANEVADKPRAKKWSKKALAKEADAKKADGVKGPSTKDMVQKRYGKK